MYNLFIIQIFYNFQKITNNLKEYHNVTNKVCNL